MTDPLQPLRPGDPIRASLLNACAEGAKIAKNLARGGGTTLDGFGTSNVLVRIQNATGKDLDRFAVVEISEPLVTPDDDEDEFLKAPAFVGKTPNRETKTRFAILQRPALRDDVVPGCVAGVSVVRLDTQNDDDAFASPDDDPDTMKTGADGAARILWKESGTGQKWGIVAFPVGGGTTIYHGTLDEEMPNQATSVFVLPDDHEPEQEPEPIRVRLPPYRVQSRPQGTKCRYYKTNDGYEMLDTDCDTGG